jgi:uncharacterized Fe-S cluster protein YjdI
MYIYTNLIPAMSNKIMKAELAGIRNKKEVSRSYSNGELTVFWRQELCIHSANCLIGLPKVFNIMHRPWINAQGASGEEIIKVVNTCPSRALTYLKNSRSAASNPRKPASGKTPSVKIQILKDGPALIHGDYIIRDSNNKKIRVELEVAAICRCGSSGKKPFCDGTHHKIGFTG